MKNKGVKQAHSSKVKAKVLGADGSVFHIMGICSKALKDAGRHAAAEDMVDKVFKSSSYASALAIMKEYVDFI